MATNVSNINTTVSAHLEDRNLSTVLRSEPTLAAPEIPHHDSRAASTVDRCYEAVSIAVSVIEFVLERNVPAKRAIQDREVGDR